jgi:fatty acid desaturase
VATFGPSVLVGIGGVLVAFLGVMIAWIEFRTNRNEKRIEGAINNLRDVLLAKLESKENVARISERLARLEGSKGIIE